MNRIIHIESCGQCPYRDHSGGLTPGGAYPLCMLSGRMSDDPPSPGYDGSVRVLPWKPALERGRPVRQRIDEIPYWCPLDKAPG